MIETRPKRRAETIPDELLARLGGRFAHVHQGLPGES